MNDLDKALRDLGVAVWNSLVETTHSFECVKSNDTMCFCGKFEIDSALSVVGGILGGRGNIV